MLNHPLLCVGLIAVAGLSVGVFAVALDGERLAAVWRARRRRQGRAGWIR